MATSPNNNGIRPPLRAVGYTLLFLTLLWAFLATVDGPAVNFSSLAGSISYTQSPRLLASKHGWQSAAALIVILRDEPPVVNASFFSFDFKQNLRRWPVLAAAVSRSPPRLVKS
jgi:hypothetical protein